MRGGKHLYQLPGITRKEEEARLAETIGIADQKLRATQDAIRELAAELHSMQEEFDASEKQMQQVWHNTDVRFREVNRDLYRAEQARKKPYFGRIDFRDPAIGHDEAYYIGRHAIARDPAKPEVIDWRAPVAGIYYDSSLGQVTYEIKGEGKNQVDLFRKRTYEIENDRLKDFYDSDVVANDELLTRYLARNKKAVLSEIIATIQQEQNEAIRRTPRHNMIVQGAAGSGKTTVAMHRISYILYNYELEFAPEDFYIIGSNQVLLNYITGVLPELNVYGVSQMTMEQLFIRLLYEDWSKEYSVKPVKGAPPVKGTSEWFHRLEKFCHRLEWETIPREDVRIEKTGVRLMSKREIENLLTRSEHMSRADKISRLNDFLIARLENEITGKYYSYTSEEKTRLMRVYRTWFGKREWKGTTLELYRSFLNEQSETCRENIETTAFDVYDLASMAYLYKRIRENEMIREAGHVVIDEAQDFGMMAYHALKYCLSKCTYTIMGDVAQNISIEYGLNDWTELKKLMLPDAFDSFGLLQKSYRNTIEISGFATEILYHGSFQIYPIQPIVRNGKPVSVKPCKTETDLLQEACSTIMCWKDAGYETIAVICKDEAEAERVRNQLAEKMPVLAFDAELSEFQTGVMVLSLEYTKGLEFDAVLIYNACEEHYPENDGCVKRLYVAATRALHELTVLYSGELTPLIRDRVPEERRRNAVLTSDQPGRKPRVIQEEKTREELFGELAREGAKDRERRNYIGPKPILVPGRKEAAKPEEGLTESGAKEIGNRKPEIPKPEIHKPRKVPETALNGEKAVDRPREMIDPRHLIPGSEFGSVPAMDNLRPEGHSRIDCSVRLCMKGKGYYDMVSSYGTLRVMPMTESRIRICFSRTGTFPAPDQSMLQPGFTYKSRETKTGVDLVTKKIWVKIDKKSGAVSFCMPDGKAFLSERAKEPRQMGTKQNYVFFDWEKKEKLEARGITDNSFLRIGQAAKYISFGKNRDRMAVLESDKGYRLLVPSAWKTMCCNLSVYGPYLSMESGNLLEYYLETKL